MTEKDLFNSKNTLQVDIGLAEQIGLHNSVVYTEIKKATEHNHFEWTDVYLADETGLTGLDRMVNEHFRRTHRKETNYSITHFAKSDYLLQLAQGIIEY